MPERQSAVRAYHTIERTPNSHQRPKRVQGTRLAPAAHRGLCTGLDATPVDASKTMYVQKRTGIAFLLLSITVILATCCACTCVSARSSRCHASNIR